MLDELVALFVGRTAKEGSFFFWRDDVVDLFVEPGIEGIAEFAIPRLVAFFAVFGAEAETDLNIATTKARSKGERGTRGARPKATPTNRRQQPHPKEVSCRTTEAGIKASATLKRKEQAGRGSAINGSGNWRIGRRSIGTNRFVRISGLVGIRSYKRGGRWLAIRKC